MARIISKSTYLLIGLLLPLLSIAQTAPTTVSWLTADPGKEVYELEGHSGLRLRNDSIDMVVNWGVFDFNAPAFVWRFALGETDYMCVAVPVSYFVGDYSMQGRTVREQVLDLSDEQSARLLALVTEAIKPENRVYRYNYVLDNCATRPLDLLQEATGNAIMIPVKDGDATFRSEMTRYHGKWSWYQFGIDLALGIGIDKPLTYEQLGFAPVMMYDILDNSEIMTPEGPKPLVKSSISINGFYPPIERHQNPWTSPMAVGVYLFLAVAVVVLSRKVKAIKIATTAVFTLQGLTGCLLTFLIFVSTHYATSPNWLYLWLNPLAFIPVVTLWIPRARRISAVYFNANIVAVIALLVLFAFHVQASNPAFYPLIAVDLLLSTVSLFIIINTKKG